MGKTLGYGEITVANVTEPFTVMLTNEAQQFATDSNRKVTSAQSYYTDIIVIRGSQERTDYTIGNITSGSGITISKSSKRVTFSVSAGTTIGADTGVIEIPITLDGQTVKKQFSWSCGKQGPQGVQGNDGNSFAWNMLSETNCGKKHWGTESSGGKYSVEDFITEDNINAVKLICTEGISTSNWSYVLFKDIKMLKQLKPSTKYTLSYDIKANRSGAISHSICKGDVSNFCTNIVVVNNIIGNETWQHISVVLTTNDLKTTPTNEILYLGRNALSKVGYSIIKNLKLVEGDINTPWSPSQSDIEGKGVVETIQYYLATSQASGVTSSTSGWSTDITTQKLTADKKYLWNCYQTKYSDGTSEPISTPKVIGVYGDKGQKGDSGEDGQDGAGFHWNLLSGTKDFDKTKMSIAGATSFDSQKYLGLTVIKAVSPTSGYIDPVAWNSTITPTPNTQYTISFYAKASVKTLVNSYFYPNCTIKCISNHQTTTVPDGAVSTMLSTEWERYSVTWTTSGSVSGTKSIIPVRLQHGISVDGATVCLCGVKLEQSDKPSPWCTTYEETLAKNLSITPSSQYFKSTDGGKTFAPNAITIKPTIQGEINFGKWQYSIDGGVSFADIVSGQKGLTISNNVLTVSRDSSLYSDAVTMVTFRAVASDSSFYDTCSVAKIYDVSDIGDGRNLWITRDNITLQACEKDKYIYTTTGTSIVCIGADGSSVGTNTIALQTGTKYTISFVISSPSEVGNAKWYFCTALNRTGVKNYGGYGVKLVTGENIVSQTITVDTSCDAAGLVLYHLPTGCVIKDIQVEKGSSPTGWTPAPEDLQTAILSTKSEISDVSLKVDNNKQAIEQRVEKTTYQQDLKLVKGDISKANEGLNKWRYEIYPKSLFANEYQGKSTMDVFAKNTNLTPSQSVLINDTDFGKSFAYGDNYIGYALTFVKFSAAKSVAITFKHDDGAHLYLNGKLIGGDDTCNTGSGESLTLSFIQGWNCLEVVLNEKSGGEYIGLGTTISAISECQLMNCYYGTPVARQSHITNQLVENTTNIKGISTKVSKVTSVIGEDGKNFTDFKNDYSDFKQTMNGFKTTVGQTYVTKDDFNGLEIGGRNLLLYSQTIRAHNNYYGVSYLIDEVETFNGCPVWSVKDQWGRLAWSFKSHVIDRGLVKVGDTLTYSLYAKTNNASGKSISCSYRFKGNAQAYWLKGSAFNIGTSWARYSATFTVTKDMLATDTYMNEIGFEETVSMSGDDKVYFACPKLERGTKATDYTEAPEDDKINGQNLVSNLPSNWEQGSVSYVANSTYASIKTVLATRLRTEDVFSVSGNVTISAGTSTNSSKEELNFYYVLFDVNKKAIGVPASGSEWQSLTSPKIINCGDAKYMAIILRWGSGSTVITPSNISQICLKIERGTSATPFTLAPEDVNGKIVNVETIANQTADKFSWIVKSGTSSSNFEITDRLMNLVSANINLDGIVSFMNTAKGDGRKNLYNLDYSSFENVASQKDAICYAKDNGVTSVSIDSSVSYDGNKSLKISYTTANLNSSTTPLYLGSSANNYGCVKIQAGKQYLLSCYVKSDSATGLFMIDIQGHDTPDTKTDGLYLSNIDPRKLPGSSTGVNLSTDWQRAVCAIKVADNATGLYWSVVPLIWGRPSSSSAPQTFNVWVDCIMLEEVDSISNEPGTYIFDKETIIDGGSIKTDTITGNQILAGSITADKIATDAIKSHNYISSGGTQGSFLNLGDGSFTSPNLSWDSNGNLIASNANLSGLINATKGTVGGWNIATNGLYSGIDENAIKIYSATTYDAQTMYQKQKIQDSFILSQKYINHFVSQQVSVGHNIPYWQTRSFIYNDSQIQLAQSDYCINTSSASNYDAQYSLKDGYISATRIYMEQNITQVGGDVINSSFSIGLDSMMGWCSIQSTKGINIYGNSSRALYVQSNDTSKYNALETEGDVVVNGKIHAVSGDNKIQLNSDNNGSIELYGNTPFIDFHSAYSSADYTCRIIANTPEQLLVCGKLRCDSNIISNNDLIANSWVYAGQNAHYTWQNQLDCYFSCGYYNNTNNVYYYAGYHAFYVNGDSGSGMMYIDTSGVSSRKGFRNSSDERIKQNFSHFDDNFIDTYMSLEPVQYQFKNDTDDKYHFGFKAQQTERILNAYGQESDKSYGICATHAIDSEKAEKLYGVKDMHEEYTLAYDELIAPTTYMVQHIYKELESTKEELIKVKQEKADLEARLQAIEAKLGL